VNLAAALIVDLLNRGIRLEADGDRLRYFPRSAATPELIERMQAHKSELIAIVTDTTSNLIEAASADRLWETAIDPAEPCANCGSLELWQSLMGDWRCPKCDPPVKAQRLRQQVDRMRKRTPRTAQESRLQAEATRTSTTRTMRQRAP